jgi:aspartate racemase
VKEKIVGIIGGMGPEATVDFMKRLIRLTPAADDVDHLHTIVDNNPKIPSRIKAIIDGVGESPLPHIINIARGLESFGADFLVLPCNTAHYYYPALQDSVHIPVLNMIELTVNTIIQDHPLVRKAGILASEAIRITGIYETCLQKNGLGAVYPQPHEQKRLMQVIKDVKAGKTGEGVRKVLEAVVADIAAGGAEVIIIACTELSIIADDTYVLPVIDAAEVLAERAVAVAKHGVKSC